MYIFFSGNHSVCKKSHYLLLKLLFSLAILFIIASFKCSCKLSTCIWFLPDITCVQYQDHFISFTTQNNSYDTVSDWTDKICFSDKSTEEKPPCKWLLSPAVGSFTFTSTGLYLYSALSHLHTVFVWTCERRTHWERVIDSEKSITHILKCHLMSGAVRLCICTAQIRSLLAPCLRFNPSFTCLYDLIFFDYDDYVRNLSWPTVLLVVFLALMRMSYL